MPLETPPLVAHLLGAHRGAPNDPQIPLSTPAQRPRPLYAASHPQCWCVDPAGKSSACSERHLASSFPSAGPAPTPPPAAAVAATATAPAQPIVIAPAKVRQRQPAFAEARQDPPKVPSPPAAPRPVPLAPRPAPQSALLLNHLFRDMAGRSALPPAPRRDRPWEEKTAGATNTPPTLPANGAITLWAVLAIQRRWTCRLQAHSALRDPPCRAASYPTGHSS